MFQPTAKVVADSLNISTGDRLTTMIIKHFRFCHSELLTHRVFSRNSSSSRSISVKRLIQNVIDDDVYPLHWGKEQKGMKASREISEQEIEQAKLVWDTARRNATTAATLLNELGVHKQVVNRVLEPFSTITVIVSATDWDNFFNQRNHPDAQPEIQALATEMLIAYKASTPDKLEVGEWHIPLIDEIDEWVGIKQALMVSTGRCARVSYLNHEGIRNLSEDVALHDRLISSEPKHLSPFEHQAIALPESVYSANFKGFKQYRKFVETNAKIF